MRMCLDSVISNELYEPVKKKKPSIRRLLVMIVLFVLHCKWIRGFATPFR